MKILCPRGHRIADVTRGEGGWLIEIPRPDSYIMLTEDRQVVTAAGNQERKTPSVLGGEPGQMAVRRVSRSGLVVGGSGQREITSRAGGPRGALAKTIMLRRPVSDSTRACDAGAVTS